VKGSDVKVNPESPPARIAAKGLSQ